MPKAATPASSRGPSSKRAPLLLGPLLPDLAGPLRALRDPDSDSDSDSDDNEHNEGED